MCVRSYSLFQERFPVWTLNKVKRVRGSELTWSGFDVEAEEEKAKGLKDEMNKIRVKTEMVNLLSAGSRVAGLNNCCPPDGPLMINPKLSRTESAALQRQTERLTVNPLFIFVFTVNGRVSAVTLKIL